METTMETTNLVDTDLETEKRTPKKLQKDNSIDTKESIQDNEESKKNAKVISEAQRQRYNELEKERKEKKQLKKLKDNEQIVKNPNAIAYLPLSMASTVKELIICEKMEGIIRQYLFINIDADDLLKFSTCYKKAKSIIKELEAISIKILADKLSYKEIRNIEDNELKEFVNMVLYVRDNKKTLSKKHFIKKNFYKDSLLANGMNVGEVNKILKILERNNQVQKI